MSLQLKLTRIVRGIKAKDLADRLGISRSYLSEIESSKKTPSLLLQRRIAKTLRLPKRALWPKCGRRHYCGRPRWGAKPDGRDFLSWMRVARQSLR